MSKTKSGPKKGPGGAQYTDSPNEKLYKTGHYLIVISTHLKKLRTLALSRATCLI